MAVQSCNSCCGCWFVWCHCLWWVSTLGGFKQYAKIDVGHPVPSTSARHFLRIDSSPCHWRYLSKVLWNFNELCEVLAIHWPYPGTIILTLGAVRTIRIHSHENKKSMFARPRRWKSLDGTDHRVHSRWYKVAQSQLKPGLIASFLDQEWEAENWSCGWKSRYFQKEIRCGFNSSKA